MGIYLCEIVLLYFRRVMFFGTFFGPPCIPKEIIIHQEIQLIEPQF